MKSTVFNKKINYVKLFDYQDFFSFSYIVKMTRSLIRHGRLLWAFNFMNSLFYALKKRTNLEPFWIILVAMLKISPDIILFPKKLGGTSKFVPLPIKENKQISFAVRWVLSLSKRQTGLDKKTIIVDALLLATQGLGPAYDIKSGYYKKGLQNAYLLKYFH